MVAGGDGTTPGHSGLGRLTIGPMRTCNPTRPTIVGEPVHVIPGRNRRGRQASMSDAEWHRNNIIDTQIISYAMKNRWPRGIEPRDISQAAISSVTAHELLEVRSADKVNSPRYYLY